MKKVLSLLTALVLGLGIQANATVLFTSNFDGFGDGVTEVNGGSITLRAYGLPTEYGFIRNDGTGGKALNIYGGQAHNGANTGAIAGLASELTAGNGLLRMTGRYRTTAAYNDVPWNQTAKIQFQNTINYDAYNQIEITTATDWQNFTLDLDLAGLAAGHINTVQANFYIGGNAPGQFQVDNLTIQTIPEPSSATLMGLGVAGLLAFRLRRKV